ncbi:Uncharacterized protein Rs2_16133 [Raphanus sativus]|nr:Uncharacterized protein Rs2_16133 [Raphanus sativus]
MSSLSEDLRSNAEHGASRRRPRPARALAAGGHGQHGASRPAATASMGLAARRPWPARALAAGGHGQPGLAARRPRPRPEVGCSVLRRRSTGTRYCDAVFGTDAPLPVVPIPRRPLRARRGIDSPSEVSPEYLETLREFYGVPEGVVFRIPRGNESSSILRKALDRFGIAISQLNVSALESWLGVVILSYELGIDLSPCRFRRVMELQGNEHQWSILHEAEDQPFFDNQWSYLARQGSCRSFLFVRIDGESVEEGFLHLFPTDWLYQREQVSRTCSFRSFGQEEY